MFPKRSLSRPDASRQATQPVDLQAFREALFRTRTGDPLLTIQVLRREARVRAGLRGHENRANRGDLTTTRDPRVDARGRADVRTTFARHPRWRLPHGGRSRVQTAGPRPKWAADRGLLTPGE